MDKVQALQNICADVNNDRLDLTSYTQVRKALIALGFTGDDYARAMYLMGYHNVHGRPHAYLVGRDRAFSEASR